jgi:tetratricopeptide (TPR) repeat protein
LSAAHKGAPTNDAATALNEANGLARLGRLAEAQAMYESILRSHGEFAEAHGNLGELHLELGRFKEAVASCLRALALNPDFARALQILGNAQARLHQPDQALQSFARAVALDPNYLDAYMNMAAVQRSVGRLAEAAMSLERALVINPQLADAHVELGTIYRLQGRAADCERSCESALRLEPHCNAALAVLAELRADLGEFREAERLHRRILSTDPEAVESVAAVARLRRMNEGDGDWLHAAQTLLRKAWPAQRERLLHFSLGKYFDDMGDFEQAFRHYRRANDLSRQCGPPHDRNGLNRMADLILHTFDRSWVAQRRRTLNHSDRPVFVVGLPRSGTSLAEQILASHPSAYGAGELSFWANECGAAFGEAEKSGGALAVSEAEIARLGTDYLKLLRTLPTDAERVIDKFPANFFFQGLIHAALPGARFIHMQRDARDTCLSIYFQQFEQANAYANDLDDLANYARQYRRLTNHWRGCLDSGRLLEVPYESLVEDPEAWSRRMLEFIGLPWDARCLAFHATQRPVVTASRWQVRQGISRSSVGRWRNYAAHLGPLLELEPP